VVGSRPIHKDEIKRLRSAFRGQFKWRNMLLFFLGVNTGFRISELLSLTIGDVLEEDGTIKERITVLRRFMKKTGHGERNSTVSRNVILNDYARQALKPWLRELQYLGYSHKTDFLFQSRTAGNKSIDRAQAWRVLRDAYRLVGMRGKLGTHAMRKTFANNVYSYFKEQAAKGEPVDVFRSTSKALGHGDIRSTDAYLSFCSEDIDDAICSVGVGA
jgi:integrase